MPDVRELFHISTQTVRPEPGFLDRQRRRQQLRSRNRKLGALTVAAAIVIGLVAIAVLSGALHGSVPASPSPPAPTAWTPGPDDSFFVDLRTGTPSPLPTSIGNAHAFYHAVSPDGSRIAFGPCCGHAAQIRIANIDGTDVRTITPPGVDAYGARWSPNGSALVYQGRDDGSGFQIGDLFVVDARTGRVAQLTHLDQSTSYQWWFLSPSFSADGTTVLFHIPRGAPHVDWDLWSVPVTGGEPTLVRRNAGFGAYAPDRRTIAYVAPLGPVTFSGNAVSAAATDGLWLFDVRSGKAQEIKEGAGITWPSWSPDGSRIAYTESNAVFVIDVASGTSAKVSDGGLAEWVDDHTLLVGPEHD